MVQSCAQVEQRLTATQLADTANKLAVQTVAPRRGARMRAGGMQAATALQGGEHLALRCPVDMPRMCCTLYSVFALSTREL